MNWNFERFSGALTEQELLEAGIEREHIGQPSEVDEPDDTETEWSVNSLEAVRPAWLCERWHDGITCACTDLLWEGQDQESALKIAREAGFFQAECGISPGDLAALCAAQGLETELVQDAEFEDLMDLLREYDGVLCAVNGAVLEVPALADWPGLMADRVVAVARVEMEDPTDCRVIVADAVTGPEGMPVSLDVFLGAWGIGGGIALGLSRQRERT